MPYRQAIFATLAPAILLAGCQDAASPADVASNADGAQAAFEQFVADINAGRIDAAAGYYDRAPGFHWVERGAVQYETGDAAAASLTSNFSPDSNSAMTLHDIRVAPMGADAAVVSAQFTFSATDQASGADFAFEGWMTVGMVRRADGWRIAAGQSGPGPTPSGFGE